MYINGLNPEIFMDWARLLHLGRYQAAYRHFEQLFSLSKIGGIIYIHITSQITATSILTEECVSRSTKRKDKKVICPFGFPRQSCLKIVYIYIYETSINLPKK